MRALAREILDGKATTSSRRPPCDRGLAPGRQSPGRIRPPADRRGDAQLSGRGLAERLTSDHRDLRVLYMSGYTDDAMMRHGVLEEGTAFLQKPFTPDALLRKVREVLD